MTRPVLYTSRLRLEPLGDQHLSAEVTLDTDPLVMAFLGGPAPDQDGVIRSHLHRLELATHRPGLGYWMAFHGDELVGLMMLPPAHGPDQPDDPDVADLGYRLAPAAWGQGYGREAASLLLAHAFDTVGVRRVIAQTRSDNTRSRRLLTTIGMRWVRDFRSLDDPGDGPLDSEYDIARTTWQQARGKH